MNVVIDTTSLVPPRGMQLIYGVQDVKYQEDTPWFVKRGSRKKVRGSKLAGMQFENIMHGRMQERYKECYIPGPWFRYTAASIDGERYVQPDGLLFLPEEGRLIIVEYKLRHTERAWWQLRGMYQPVIKFFFRDWITDVVEIFRYNHKVQLPEKPMMVKDILTPVAEYKMHKAMGV